MAGGLPANIAKQILLDYIDNGKVTQGERLPSVRELKQRYMTTNTTICSALTILENQGRVEKIHGKGNYVRDLEPAGPGANAKPFIGAILPHPAGNSMIAPLSVGIERCAREYGQQLMMAISNEDYNEEHEDVRRLIEAGCRGIVMCPVVRMRHQLRSDYLAREFTDFPIVLMDMAFPEQKRSMVVVDNFRAAYDMTNHLIARGHRRIGFLDWRVSQGELMSRSVRDRYAGYIKALKAAGLQPVPEDLWQVTYPKPDQDTRPELIAYLEKWKKARERATAIIALEDNWALTIIQFAEKLGIRIPKDLVVTGFDNCPNVGLSQPSFPTSNPAFEKMGETAVHILMQHINMEIDAPVHYMMPAPLKVRDGLGNDALPPKSSDPQMAIEFSV